MLVEGATFGPYEVRRRLAVGGMGEVFLCRHRVLDRFDAVKVLRPHLAGNADFRRRFLREALSAARLRHPHVVTVYTADERDGLLYLAMEYVAGADLAALIANHGRLELTRTVRLVRTAADALDAAHAAHLVHRDVKPSNLLVTAPGTPSESVTLVDFGVSRLLDADAEITRTGEIVGTIAYSAPEQLSRGAIGGACDQYALACVAYQCLTGQVPYPRESQLAIMTAHLRAEPPSAAAQVPGLPRAVDAVLARAMAKDPAARFPTCTAFAAALDRAAGTAASGTAAAGSVVEDGGSAFPDPDALLTMIRGDHPGLLRRPGEVDFGALRLGWSSGAPMVINGDALLIRAEPEPAAGLVRWLLAQAVARHRARHLCLVCVLAPVASDGWMWVNWLPHARPDNPPVVGPHYATSAETGADLIARLQAVLADRRAGIGTRSPRVLAIVDAAFGFGWDLPGLAEAASHGVDLVAVAPPGSRAPAGVSTLDITAAGATLTRSDGATVTGRVEQVEARYVRDLAELLPEA